MNYDQSNVLITGGMGFIGSHLARRLVQMGAKVTIIDNVCPNHGANPFNIHDIKHDIALHIGDVRDQTIIKHLIKKQHYLFNLAGQTGHTTSMSDPQTDLEINVIAQLSLLEACRQLNPDIKIIFTSTRQIYGKPESLPVNEQHPINPMDINGIHKAASERYHLLYHTIYGIRACVLRLTNTYGPGMRIQDARQCFLGIWIRRLMENKTIKIFGTGAQQRDFNYVDDCVDALLLAGKENTANGKTYNLGSHEVITLHQLAKTLINLKAGGDFEFEPFPPERKQIDIGDYYSDFSRISNKLQWQPKTTLHYGLQQTLNFYQQNLHHYLSSDQSSQPS